MCICLNNASLSGPAIPLHKIPILAKIIIFSDEAHFDLGGYGNKQNCRIWGTENSHTYIEKPTHPKRVTVWCGFWSKSIIGSFFVENERGEDVTVHSDRYGEFIVHENYCSRKLNKKILSTFGFNRTSLLATQPRLHSMFCSLFWKIVLSAAELMSFVYFGAAI